MSSKTERDPALSSSQLAAIRAKWTAAGLATEPASRSQAMAAISTLYGNAGLAKPRIEWCGSPADAIRQLCSGRHASRLHHIGAIDRARRTPVLAAWYGDVDWNEAGSVRDVVAERVWRNVGHAVETEAIRNSGRIGSPPFSSGSNLAKFGLLGQHDAPSMALHEVLRDLQHVISPSETLDALAELTMSAGLCIPLDGVCLLAERHHMLHLDDRGRLHAEHGPALAYPDGMTLHAWHGTVVPADAIADPASITAARIELERDVHIRRALVEIHGTARYFRTSARIVSEDECGRLWTKTFLAGGTWQMVEVDNATAEPDGSHRQYFLRVPPTMRTAREAVAWTYGLRADEYVLARRT